MKNLLALLLFTLSVFSFAGTTIVAQTTKRSSTQTIKAQVKAETRPFDFSIFEELPKNYLGHSYGDLYRALINREKEVAKGEYESTIDNKSRIAKLNQKPLVGTTNFHSRFAFTFLPGGEQFVMKYDADRAALAISVIWTHRYEFGDFSLTWSESSRKVGSYIGRNAFNRSVRVSVYRNDSFYLITKLENLKRIGTFTGDSQTGSVTASVPMNINDARVAKVNLRTLVIGHLAKSPIFDHQSHDVPEITDPYDRHNFDHAINLEVEEIWIYDYRTGNVLLRFGVNRAEIKETSPLKPEPPSVYEPKPKVSPPPIRTDSIEELRILAKPKPAYTDAARQNKIEGTVILRVTFMANGSIGSISTVKGLSLGLTEQAIAAARLIRFEPSKIKGIAQTVTRQIEYDFQLD